MQPYQQAKAQIKIPVVIFLKMVGPPLILYVDNPEELYQEFIDIIKNASERNPKLIEKKANGPVKTVAILDTQIAGVALQEETYVNY